MSDDRLTRAEEGDDARLLDAAGRERLAVAAADIRLPPSLRLTEWQRATVSALMSKTIRAVEDELRASLADSAPAQDNAALHAALTSAHVSIAGPILERSAAHLETPLVAALLRRAEEHRRARTLELDESSLLVELIRDDDELVAGQAMAMLIAHSRRFDRFTEPTAADTELSAELEHRLVWRVAAALRHYLVRQHEVDPVAADGAVVSAAERALGGYDEGASLEAYAMRLVRRLDDQRRLNDELIERALSEGLLPMFIAAVAARAGLSQDSAWEIFSDPRRRGAAFLLRAAGMARAEAASILLHLAASEDEAGAQLDLFEVTSIAAARQSLRLWQIDPAYREALAELAA